MRHSDARQRRDPPRRRRTRGSCTRRIPRVASSQRARRRMPSGSRSLTRSSRRLNRVPLPRPTRRWRRTGSVRTKVRFRADACTPSDKTVQTAVQYRSIARKRWKGGRNHNPRVGGSSPSSGIEKCLESERFSSQGFRGPEWMCPRCVPGSAPILRLHRSLGRAALAGATPALRSSQAGGAGRPRGQRQRYRCRANGRLTLRLSPQPWFREDRRGGAARAGSVVTAQWVRRRRNHRNPTPSPAASSVAVSNWLQSLPERLACSGKRSLALDEREQIAHDLDVVTSQRQDVRRGLVAHESIFFAKSLPSWSTSSTTRGRELLLAQRGSARIADDVPIRAIWTTTRNSLGGSIKRRSWQSSSRRIEPARSELGTMRSGHSSPTWTRC